MFQKSDGDGHTLDTIIGSSIKVDGNFVGEGNIVVEGEVKGNLKTSQDLQVGGGSKITADIEAANALVAGEISGNLKINGKLELTSTAKIIGDIEADILIVASGASISGHCQIGGNGSLAANVKEEREKEDKED